MDLRARVEDELSGLWVEGSDRGNNEIQRPPIPSEHTPPRAPAQRLSEALRVCGPRGAERMEAQGHAYPHAHCQALHNAVAGRAQVCQGT